MCFRPSEAIQGLNCPECGTLNPGVAKVCRSCGADLEEYKAELAAKAEAGEELPDIAVTPVGSPTAPPRPGAPGTTAPPATPGAPAAK